MGKKHLYYGKSITTNFVGSLHTLEFVALWKIWKIWKIYLKTHAFPYDETH